MEKYSKDVLESLKGVELDASEEMKQLALNINDLLDMDDIDDGMDDDEKTKIKFLVEQLILQSKKVYGERYVTNMMKAATCLYLYLLY